MKRATFPSGLKYVIGSLAGSLIWLAIKAAIGPKGVAYVDAHLFLTLFLPLAVIFVLMLAREVRRQYKP